jgi:hypothetical protein
MSGFWLPPDDWQQDVSTLFGSAHSVSSEAPPDDPAAMVRAVAEEITGQPMPVPQRRIGF